MPPIPVVIDTDIGADPDDAMALAFAVVSPEIDVLGVTVVDGDVELRARMAARILGMLGRADIPVFLGERQPVGPGCSPTMLGFEGRGLLDLPYDGPESSIAAEPAVSWLCQQARQQPYYLIAIGPLTSVAKALESSAALSEILLGLTIMGGVFNVELLPQRAHEDIGRWGIRAAWPDHNTASDPNATLLCARSDVPITWVTSEITFGVPLHRATLSSLSAACWPTRALVGVTYAWSDWWRRNVESMELDEDPEPQRTSTYLHDPLTVASLFSNTWLQLERKTLVYNLEDGVFRMYAASGQEAGRPANVSISADGGMFESEFMNRLIRQLQDGRNLSPCR